jgi:hypothetical protein
MRLTQGVSCHAVHPAELELLRELLPRLYAQPVALLLRLDEADQRVLGLAQLMGGARAEAIELSEVDLRTRRGCRRCGSPFADQSGAASVYWLTQEYNAPARCRYDTLAHGTSFFVYQR